MNILTINAGSSSIKYKVFTATHDHPTAILSGLIEGIGEKKGNWNHADRNKTSTPHQFPSHKEAFAALAEKLQQTLQDFTIQAVGHRVVHGGNTYFSPTLVTQKVLKDIIALSPLAPLHNPVNALGIEFAMHYFPQAKHIAFFDSGFHHSIPQHIHTYAIDSETAKEYHIKRYGFHGLNHEYVTQQAALYLKKPLAESNFITLHLGNGASACLIKNGQSFDTTMGMTPLAGLIMGSRSGDIDPAIPIYLQKQGLSLNAVDELLIKKSGLIGIAKENDMRHLLTRLNEGDKAAQLAIDMYIYAIQKVIGAYLTQLPHLDALIFTGGIGENAAPIRERILEPLQHLGFKLKEDTHPEANCRNLSKGKHPILVIRGDEEYFIAQGVRFIY